MSSTGFVAPEVSCSCFNSFVGGVGNYGIEAVCLSAIKKVRWGSCFFFYMMLIITIAYLVVNDKIIPPKNNFL